MTARYDGDLRALRDHPNFGHHPGAIPTYLRERTLRHADRLAEGAATLVAAGATHKAVMDALAAAENVAREYPDDRASHAAATDAYAAKHGLRGWSRSTTSASPHRARVHVGRLRTSADGETGRYYPQATVWGGRSAAGDGTWYRIADHDGARKGDELPGFSGATRGEALAAAEEWIRDAEAGRGR